MKKIYFFIALALSAMTARAEVIRLDLEHPTNPEAFTFDANGMWTETWNATDYPYFESQIFGFSHLPSGNSYSGTSYEGFTVSKATKDGDGYAQWYSNMAKGGLRGKGSPYIYGYYSEYWLMDEKNEDMTSSNLIIFNDGEEYYPRYVYVNNSLIGYHDVTEGDWTGYKFQKGDKFELWIQALDEDFYHELSDDKVVYRLADFTSDNEEEWFINTEWEKVDLSELGACHGLAFTLVSTGKGASGTNTSLYFALDGLTVTTIPDEEIPEPLKIATFEDITLAKADTCWQGADEPIVGWNNWKSGDYNFQSYYGGNLGMGDYYAAITVTNETANTSTGYTEPYRSAKGGAYEGDNFAVAYVDTWNPDTVTFDAQVVKGLFVNNTAYDVNEMVHGGFTRKFGKDDWFKLTIHGMKDGAAVDAVVDFYLANDGKYVNEWTYVDLTALGEVDAITFSLSSTDNDPIYGMNTPAYFCFDNFGMAKPAGYVAPEMAAFPADETAIDQTTNDQRQTTKLIRNGQVLIIREGKIFNILGAEL